MRIAVASGKGGAGKTSLVSSLAPVWERPLLLVDADVEAPNLHLFLHPEISREEAVTLPVPELNAEACTLCGRCREICSYKAIAKLGRRLKIFGDMCHGCGGCFAVCPANALRQGFRELGTLSEGKASGRSFLMGRTHIGEAMTPPLLRTLLRRASDLARGVDTLIDCPPGVSCPAMTVVQRADLVLLAAEPTPFGFHDFSLAVQAFSRAKVPLAVVMNRAKMPGNEAGDAQLRDFCRSRGLPLLAEVPFSRTAAEYGAQGGRLCDISEDWHSLFAALAQRLRKEGVRA